MELTDTELVLLDEMLDSLFDEMSHHPSEFDESEVADHGSLRKKVRDEAKRRGLWWAR